MSQALLKPKNNPSLSMQDVTDAAELEDALRTQDADTIVSIKYKDHFFLWYLEILRKLCQIIEIIRWHRHETLISARPHK